MGNTIDTKRTENGDFTCSPLPVVELFDVLADQSRLALIRVLAHCDGRVLLEDAVASLIAEADNTTDGTETTQDDVRIGLVHFHLPMLAETDIIEYDDGDRTISRGDHFTQLEPILEVVRTTYSQ